MRQSFEMILAAQCAPTLAGVKPASLFRWSPDRTAGLMDSRRETGETEELRWKRILAPCGIHLRVLKVCPRTGDRLVYLYREHWIREILNTADVRDFLSGMGYDIADNCSGLLRQLGQRLCTEAPFPHEIGVFLGYPLEDVTGFMQHHGQNYTYCGCWKVYGNPEEAKRRFAEYHRCTAFYCESVRSGIPLTSLLAAA